MYKSYSQKFIKSIIIHKGTIPIIIFTGSAETPRVIDISTSNRRPPIRIEKATQRGPNNPKI